MTAPTKRTKSNEEESSTLTALMVDGDYVFDSCSERDFYEHGCSKVNEVSSVAMNLFVWGPFPDNEVYFLVGRPYPVYVWLL